MILRSLSRAIRKQNYYAVFLELAIVILGIVIGFQVNQWAADRSERTREASYLLRLDDGFAEILEEFEGAFGEIDAYHDRTMTFLDGIRSGDRTLARQGAWGPYAITEIVILNLQPAVLTELISTGDLRLIGNPALRNALASVPNQQANLNARLSQMADASTLLDREVAVRFEVRPALDGKWGPESVEFDFEAIAGDERFLRQLGRAVLDNRVLRGHLERRAHALRDIQEQLRTEIAARDLRGTGGAGG